MIINSIKNLCDYLKARTVDEVDWDKVESLTSEIIIDDGYEQLPEDVQDTVELFDSWELESPGEKDRHQLIALLDSYLDKSLKPEE